MTSEQFLIANGVLFAAIVAYLFFRGGDTKPVRLRMRDGEPPPMTAKVLPGSKMPTPRDIQDEITKPGIHIQTDVSRSLNVLFNYNGHTWDAYEVLGCPAGASFELAKKSYEKARQNQKDPQSVEFLEHALEAIRSAKQAQG